MAANTAFALLVGTAFILRLVLVLLHDGYLGVDGGAYLLSRNAVLGIEDSGVVGPGLPRPPLAPGWLLVPFTHLWGDDIGYKLFSALGSLAPLGAVWLLGRRFLSDRLALFAVGFLSVDLLHAEMLVTGVMPLIGFSLILTCVWAVTVLATKPTRVAFTVLMVTLPLISFTNQTSAGMTAVVLPAYTLTLYFLSPGPWLWRRVLPAGVVGGLLALTALPWYLPHLPGSGLVHYPGAWLYPAPWYDSSWIQAAIAVPVGAFCALRGHTPTFRALGVLTIILGLLLPWFSTDETLINIFYRSRYLVMVPLTICLVWAAAFAAHGFRYKVGPVPVGIGAVGLLFLVVTLGYVSQVGRQSEYSLMISPATARALAETDAEGYVANSYTFALWVAALERVPTSWTWTWRPPRSFEAEDAAVRCILGWSSGCDVAASAKALGVSHVLVDTRFPYYNERAPSNYLAPPRQWEVTAASPWLTNIFEQGSTKVWRITP